MPYNQAYFEKWYRSEQRVHAPAERSRTVRMVLSVADYMLGRSVRSVLDIGAGEGLWLPVLRRLRPGIRYAGVDPSAYAVQRFGRARNLHLGTLGGLPRAVTRGRYDLIVCSGVLNYLPLPELREGLRTIAGLARGVAFLELFTTRDDVEGDARGRRPAAVYRRALARAGFRHCGPHCYVGPAFDGLTVEMEVA